MRGLYRTRNKYSLRWCKLGNWQSSWCRYRGCLSLAGNWNGYGDENGGGRRGRESGSSCRSGRSCRRRKDCLDNCLNDGTGRSSNTRRGRWTNATRRSRRRENRSIADGSCTASKRVIRRSGWLISGSHAAINGAYGYSLAYLL